MAKMVLVSTFLSLSGNDLSTYTSKVEVTTNVEPKDVTTFGSGGWKEVLGGLKDGQVAVTWKNDLAAGLLDSILWPLFGTVVTFEVRGTSAVVGTSNPKFTGSVLINSLTPIGGSVGDVNEQSNQFPTSGAVARATA